MVPGRKSNPKDNGQEVDHKKEHLEMAMTLELVGQVSTKLEDMEAEEEKELREGPEMAETQSQLALLVNTTIVEEKAGMSLNPLGPRAPTGEEIGITIGGADRDREATIITEGQSTDNPFCIYLETQYNIR